MRVVSLLPSATEILFALGFDHEIVGVSHECDYPPRAKTKAVVIHSRLPENAHPAEIDRLVREFTERGESLYSVDADLLEELAPDLIVTQNLCHVCAASPEDLAAALARFRYRPEVLSLNPRDLGDVWRDILWVGEVTGRSGCAQELVENIAVRLGEIGIEAGALRQHPRVAFLEWLQPFYVGGHWVPEMISRAGGRDVLGLDSTPSYRVAAEEIIEAAPDVLLVAPCGYAKEQARDEYLSLSVPAGWREIPAVRNERVYALGANSYFSRPGPRLIVGIEILLKTFSPGAHVSAEAAEAFLPIHEAASIAKVASA